MWSRHAMKAIAFSLVLAGIAASASAARLVEVRPVDEEYLMLYWQDATVDYKDDGKGDNAFMGHESGGGDTIRKFGEPLDTAAATSPDTYSLTSADDANYAAAVPGSANWKHWSRKSSPQTIQVNLPLATRKQPRSCRLSR